MHDIGSFFGPRAPLTEPVLQCLHVAPQQAELSLATQEPSRSTADHQIICLPRFSLALTAWSPHLSITAFIDCGDIRHHQLVRGCQHLQYLCQAWDIEAVTCQKGSPYHTFPIASQCQMPIRMNVFRRPRSSTTDSQVQKIKQNIMGKRRKHGILRLSSSFVM
jgi:hypothetical protein